jgi:hypothetical protein
MTRWAEIMIFSIIVASQMEHANATDAIPSTRQTILLTVTEQDYLIGEMHRNLEALSSIISALAQNDARNAEQAAASRGMASYGDRDPSRPKTLSAKLPPAWKPMATSLRQGFDQLAESLSAHETTAQSLRRVSQLMAICTGCHASFRFVTQP